MRIARLTPLLATIACGGTTPNASGDSGASADRSGRADGGKPLSPSDAGSVSLHPNDLTCANGAHRSALETEWDASALSALALDACCPSFELFGFVTVTTPAVHGLAEAVTALGCCLPSGRCGAAVPVEKVRPAPGLPGSSFAGWGPPDHCARYGDISGAPADPTLSCRYPLEASDARIGRE